MYLTLTAKTAKALSQRMQKTITRKTKLPILRQLLVEGNEERQVFISTDNVEERLTFRVPAKEVRDASGNAFLIPFDDFKNITKGMKKNDTLHVISEGEQVTLSHESKGVCVPHVLPTMSFEEFPSSKVKTNIKQCDPTLVLDAFKELATFTSANSKRISLQGVFCDNQRKNMVATDGHRMGLIDFDGEDFPFGQDVIIPATPVLAKGILNGYGGVSVATTGEGESEQQVLVIHAGAWQYQVYCIDHVFPPYMEVIPDSDPENPRISFNMYDMAMMCDVLRQYASKKVKNHVVLYADGEGVSLLLPQDSSEKPFHKIPLSEAECESISNQASTWLPASQLLDALNVGYNHLEIPDGWKPVRFTDPDNGIHIMMPMEKGNNEKVF